MAETDPRRSVPRTDVVLDDPRLVSAQSRLGRAEVRAAVTKAQDRARAGEIPPDAVADVAVASLPAQATTLRPIINATGVLLHTNLGRAPLSEAARAALVDAAGFVDVEFDLDSGERTRRGQGALSALLTAVPAAGDALVVNNNAAAVVLAATALAAGREIIVSRGELVEIGDGFRLPDLVTSTGARLREVGATNRTSLADYRGAIGPDTAFILKVHPSNFVVSGFVASVPLQELAALDVPVVADIGSGLLRPDALLPDEPDATTSLESGAALVTASGDKLLGGPQAGLVLGEADLVTRLRRHPLARALRPDKLTFAALEATLRGPVTPLHEALHASYADLERRAEQIASRLRRAGLDATVVTTESTVGAGGAPGVTLPSAAIAVAADLAEPLRRGDPAVVGRVHQGRCLLDLRAVPPHEDAPLESAVLALVPPG